MVALPSELTPPADAVNVAEVELAGIDTDAGTVRAALLDDRDTAVAVVGDAVGRVTVQVLVAPDVRLEGLQVSDDRLTGACSESVLVADVPLSVAVMVALPLVVIVPAAAVKFAVVELAATMTEVGTVRAALLDESETVVLPLSAAFDNVTVQALFAPEVTIVGEQ
jgi:small basic protein